MSSGVVYRVLRATGELEALTPAWRELCNHDRNCTPFQSPEWLIPWWHHFGNGKLRAVTITQNGGLIGLLPFYVYCRDNDSDRRLLLLGVGTTDYLDGVFAPGCNDEHIRIALNRLCDDRDWDVLDGSQLQRGSKLIEAVRDSSEQYSVFETEVCSRMAATRISDLPQKIRRNVMYYRNRATRCDALELTLADAATCRESFDMLVELHTERWRERGCAGVLADPRVQGWHREALPLLARSGILRLYTLRLGGETIGIIYSLVDPVERPNRAQYFYLTGYSTNHSDLRPGTLSIAMAIEHAFNDGVQTIDMLRGEEEYKKLWHMERQSTYGFSLPSSAIAKARLQRSVRAA